MIYINNELVKGKDRNLFYNFVSMFRGNIDENNGIRPDNPIIIKYRDGLSKPDKDNPGKILQPASISLSFVAKINDNGSMVEVRYSPVAPTRDKSGDYVFPQIGTEVVRGRMPVWDIDLAFFFWAYSNQNATSLNAGANAYFQIENAEAERRLLAIAKEEDSIIRSRIFNRPELGGLSIETLRMVGKTFMMSGVDKITDPNELKLNIEKMTFLNDKNKQIFLSLTDKPNVTDEEYADRRAIIVDAIDNLLITHTPTKQSFYLTGDDGKEKSLLFCYKDLPKDKTAKIEHLYMYLEQHKPELLDDLKVKLEAMSQTA